MTWQQAFGLMAFILGCGISVSASIANDFLLFLVGGAYIMGGAIVLMKNTS